MLPEFEMNSLSLLPLKFPVLVKKSLSSSEGGFVYIGGGKMWPEKSTKKGKSGIIHQCRGCIVGMALFGIKDLHFWVNRYFYFVM